MAAIEPIPSILDPASLYYIHLNENPSLVLVSPILDGANYHSWQRAMTMALEMKNKFIFADGTIQKPVATGPAFPAWKRNNTLVLSWLIRSMNSEIATSILWINEAYVVWQTLRNCFSQGDQVRISQLHSDLHSLK